MAKRLEESSVELLTLRCLVCSNVGPMSMTVTSSMTAVWKDGLQDLRNPAEYATDFDIGVYGRVANALIA